MNKLILSILLFACLLFLGCRSKHGRQNIQYIRPVEDSTTFNDIDQETADTLVEEDYEDELGTIPSEDDYDKVRSNEIDKEMDRFLGY